MKSLDELEALAAAATPGPWMLATSNSWRRFVSTGRDRRSVCEPIKQNDGHPDLYFKNGGADGPDAAYIAAFSPDVGAALVAVAKAAQVLTTLQAGVKNMAGMDALRTALGRLEKAGE